DLIARIRKMRNYGIESDYHTFWPGMNGKMSEFHAIIGVENLKRLDELMAARQKKAKYFFDRIQSVSSFVPAPWPKDVLHTFKDLTVLTPEKREGKRHAVVSYLKERDIKPRSYFFPPLHEQKYFQPYVDRSLPATEQLS